ncbi:Response regulator [uncultured Gammaproteobacteria bacterium]
MARAPSLDELEERLRIEFIDDAHDRLVKTYAALEAAAAGVKTDTEALAMLRMEAHNMKGCGTSFGFPAVSLVAHRMEDYLTGVAKLDKRQLDDAHTFLDKIAELVDRREQPALAETNLIVRSLPARYVFEVADVEVRDCEIMLVTPSKVVARKVGIEMAACGYRPVTVQDPIEALGMAVRVPPDMLIASLVMDHLGGVDLIRALKAMSITAKMPMALLTSLDLGNAALKDVPKGVGVIRVGSQFGEDFAAQITRFNMG